MPLKPEQLKELEDDYHYWKEDVPRNGRIAVHVTRDQLLAKYGTKMTVKSLDTAKELGITVDSKKNMIIGRPKSVYLWLSLINLQNDNADFCIAEALRKSRSKWTLESLKEAAEKDKQAE
ncbi:MAG: hypothetical protein MJ239_04000 [Bacilli bacterium]|nr:hypothetical protein [Bacilli bacterium]